MARKLKFPWNGETFFIAEDRWFEIAEEVEDFITIFDITNFQKRPKLSKLARAYSMMINFAEGEVTHNEVYRALQKQLGDVKNKGKAGETIAARALIALQELVLGVLPEEDKTSGVSEPTVGGDGESEKKATRTRARRS